MLKDMLSFEQIYAERCIQFWMHVPTYAERTVEWASHWALSYISSWVSIENSSKTCTKQCIFVQNSVQKYRFLYHFYTKNIDFANFISLKGDNSNFIQDFKMMTSLQCNVSLWKGIANQWLALTRGAFYWEQCQNHVPLAFCFARKPDFQKLFLCRFHDRL